MKVLRNAGWAFLLRIGVALAETVAVLRQIPPAQPYSIAVNPMMGQMYFTASGTGEIQMADLNGENVKSILSKVDGLMKPTGIALDMTNALMYIADMDAKKIMVAKQDGSGLRDVVVGPTVGSPFSLAVDVPNSKVYWSNPSGKQILKANITDGSNIEVVSTGAIAYPAGVALGPAVGGCNPAVYWSDTGTPSGAPNPVAPKITRMCPDGSSPVVIASAGLTGPTGITVDAANSAMYITSPGEHSIKRMKLDGDNLEVIITPTHFLGEPKKTIMKTPIGISFDSMAETVYFTDAGTNRIIRYAMGEGGYQMLTIGAIFGGLALIGGGIAASSHMVIPFGRRGRRRDEMAESELLTVECEPEVPE